MKITKEDFYCGAFLSFLLNNGIKPALFEEGVVDNRKIYDFTTDKDDFRVYVKFSEKPASKSEIKGSCIWNFPFTDRQLQEIKNLHIDKRKIYFVFICGSMPFNETKIATVSYEDVLQCIELNPLDKYKSQGIKIRLQKNGRSFQVYGTLRSDKINQIDNTLKIPTTYTDSLFGTA